MTTDYPVADAARIVALILGGGNIALTLYLGFWYGRAYMLYRRTMTKWNGAAAEHVALVAASYNVLIVATLVETYNRVHEPFTWRLPTYIVAYLLGIAATWIIVGFERDRVLAPHAPRRAE